MTIRCIAVFKGGICFCSIFVFSWRVLWTFCCRCRWHFDFWRGVVSFSSTHNFSMSSWYLLLLFLRTIWIISFFSEIWWYCNWFPSLMLVIFYISRYSLTYHLIKYSGQYIFQTCMKISISILSRTRKIIEKQIMSWFPGIYSCFLYYAMPFIRKTSSRELQMFILIFLLSLRGSDCWRLWRDLSFWKPSVKVYVPWKCIHYPSIWSFK